MAPLVRKRCGSACSECVTSPPPGPRSVPRRRKDVCNDEGWALVENTSDDDWNDVRMVLVSGKPISFKMNLYDPIYIPRPFVEPEMFASLRPPVYAGSMGESEMRRIAEAAAAPMNGPGAAFG